MRRIILFCFFIFFTAVFAQACAQQKKATVAKRVVLRDAVGQDRAVLELGEKQAKLHVRDEHGRDIFYIDINERGLILETIDEEGNRQGGTLAIEALDKAE